MMCNCTSNSPKTTTMEMKKSWFDHFGSLFFNWRVKRKDSVIIFTPSVKRCPSGTVYPPHTPSTGTVHFYDQWELAVILPLRLRVEKRRRFHKALSEDDSLHLAASWTHLRSCFLQSLLDPAALFQVKYRTAVFTTACMNPLLWIICSTLILLRAN